jgi:hypothetical protein
MEYLLPANSFSEPLVLVTSRARRNSLHGLQILFSSPSFFIGVKHEMHLEGKRRDAMEEIVDRGFTLKLYCY